MSERERKTGTFIVKIFERRNATWQGSVTWVEEHKEQYFRSALELLKMIDGALDGADNEKIDEVSERIDEIEGGSHEK
jgi:uncharacterized protein YpiB (UPF0302 family)